MAHEQLHPTASTHPPTRASQADAARRRAALSADVCINATTAARASESLADAKEAILEDAAKVTKVTEVTIVTDAKEAILEGTATEEAVATGVTEVTGSTAVAVVAGAAVRSRWCDCKSDGCSSGGGGGAR